MILEELVGVFVHLSSTLVTHAPATIRQDSRESKCSLTNEENVEDIPPGVLHREYEELRESTSEPLPIERLEVVQSTSRSIRTSLLRSLQVSASLLLAVVLFAFFATALVYIDLNTRNLCAVWNEHLNHTASTNLRILRTIGITLGTLPIYAWFPTSVAMLWGLKEFKAYYLRCFRVVLVAAAISMAYKGILGEEKFYMYPQYRWPEDVMFSISLLYAAYLVTREYKRVNLATSYSTCHIFFTLIIPFAIGVAFAYVLSFVIIAQFNKTTATLRTVITAVSPGIVVFPTAISKYLVLWKSSEIIPLDRAFVLCYILRCGALVFFRTMQADFQNIWIFIGLSIAHAFSNIFTKATWNIRLKIWKCFIRHMNKTRCGSKLKVAELNTPRARRLNTDLEIQYMLFEYATVILSQIYLSLFRVWNFDIYNPWQVIRASLIRIANGLAIDFLCNIVAMFLEIHFHNLPIRRVWLNHWRRHLFASVFFLTVIVTNFGPALVAVFDAQEYKTQEYKLRNCSSHWLGFRVLQN